MSSTSLELGSTTAFWYAASHVSKAVVSCRFRIGHFAELMPGANVVIGPTFPEALLDQVGCVICVRPFVDESMAVALERMRHRGIRRIADFDDLLFDGPPYEFPSVLQRRSDPRIVAARIGVYRRGLASFDAFTASTPSLANHLREAAGGDREVHVVPNGLSRAWVKAGRAAARPYREGDRKTIRYLAGSPTHDIDLALVAPTLARFLDDHRDASLELAGHFDHVPSELDGRAVTIAPIRPYMLLPLLLAPSYLTLAPLVDTPFSRCKSDVKFLESGAFGAPTLASDSVVYRHHAGNGLVTCGDADAWYGALEALWDESTRAEASGRALARVEHRGLASLGALRRAIGGEAAA